MNFAWQQTFYSSFIFLPIQFGYLILHYVSWPWKWLMIQGLSNVIKFKGKFKYQFHKASNTEDYSILLPKLFWPTVRKCFEIQGWWPRICKRFDITRTIWSNSKRSEQFLITECLFNLFLEVSQIWWSRTIRIQIGKNYWDLKTCRTGKVRKM